MARPRAEIDWTIVKKLCAIQATRKEIASFLEISDSTLVRHCHMEYDCDFDTLYKQWSDNGKISLRRLQFKLAETNAALCIWLGKQYLGQTDKVIHVQENEFERLSDEDLIKAEKELIEEKQQQGKLIIDVKSTRATETNQASQDSERKD